MHTYYPKPKKKASEAVILSIETSCDETAVALSQGTRLQASLTRSQDLHAPYGGVVPELAARDHEKNLPMLVAMLIEKENLHPKDIDAIAFTQGPGLIGALLTGCMWAKAFAWARQIPLMGIDHLQAHLLSVFLEASDLSFPYLGLIASGGHTQLFVVCNAFDLELLTETQDDAIGEAFDKAARLLGLGYPGGAAIDQLAKQGNPHAFNFLSHEGKGMRYSFSGIKTFFLYFLKEASAKDSDFIAKNQADLCASIQHALLHMLSEPLWTAQHQTGLKQVAVVGGVAANSALAKQLHQEAKTRNCQVFIPRNAYCTDNAAMVARTAYECYCRGMFSSWDAEPYARHRFDTKDLPQS